MKPARPIDEMTDEEFEADLRVELDERRRLDRIEGEIEDMLRKGGWTAVWSSTFVATVLTGGAEAIPVAVFLGHARGRLGLEGCCRDTARTSD